MKSEAQVRRVLQHMVGASRASRAQEDQAILAALEMLRDVLSWVVDEPSKFESMFVKPCDQVEGIN